MGRVVLKYNHLPRIIKRLPGAIDDEVNEAAEDMAAVLKTILWVDTGMIRRVTTDREQGEFHAEVWIGYNRGHGFYSRFQEWGTEKQAARPIVGPTAHSYEPVYASLMSRAIRKACDV
jgi:HK97 gp10 family phage protein